MGLPMDYNSYAAKYAYTRKAVEWILKPLERAISKLSGSSDVVEAGCGTGNYIIELSKRLPFHNYTGFDVAEGMLEVAKSRSEEVEFMQGNADESFPLKDNCADIGYAVDVVHHLVNYKTFFKECGRIIKPQGRLFIVTDSEENFRRRSLTKYFPEILEIERNRYPAIELLEEHGLKAGLKLTGRELAEGTMLIDDTLISNFEEKASSAMRLMKEVDHTEGIKRLKENKGKGWISSYTVLEFLNDKF